MKRATTLPTQVFLHGQSITVDPQQVIGRGGEAEVYDLGNGQALKLFKDEHHPDYDGQRAEQLGARQRLQEHQTKLRLFPKGLPKRVITPTDLATEDRLSHRIVGYTMPLVQGAVPLHRYAERSWRQAGGIPTHHVVELLLALWQTVRAVHAAQVIIGDFNDLNVLVRDRDPYLIDADSFQFQSFLCSVYTSTFVDPLLCHPHSHEFGLAQPYNTESDWYAFAIMVMQCLLSVGPYGGVFKPQRRSQHLPHTLRPHHRITVFHPEVRYPKPAIPYGVLPDDLLHYFHQVFERDQRGSFPETLLRQLQWTTCHHCGLEHARDCCPHCLKTGRVKQIIRIRGTVTSAQIFHTPGVILCAAMQQGELTWLYHTDGDEGGEFRREDGQVVLRGDRDPWLRYRLAGSTTLMGKGRQVMRLTSQDHPERWAVDAYDQIPVFDVNLCGCYWIHNGQLLRQGSLGSEYIGDVLAGHTLFWVGSRFGFGFYRAGNLHVAFVFDAQRRGLNDNVALPTWSGALLDATCCFSEDRCWFFWAAQEQGRTLHRCAVLDPAGSVLASAQGEFGDGSWLGTLGGKWASGQFLLAATDEGVLCLGIDQGQIIPTQTFPDTEPFVDAGCHLFLGNQGLYVVSTHHIARLTIT